MANLLKCEFPGGIVRKVGVDAVASYLGRGVHGAEYVNSLAERADVVVCDCQIDDAGLVVLGSTERPLTDEERELSASFSTWELNPDRVLGLGEFAPKLTPEQEAARERLMRDFLAPSREHFGLDGSRGPKLDPIHARLASWATGGADNTRRVGDVLYSWTAHPRLQQNGAGLGRVYAQRRGESPVDIGGYKIDKDGNVLEFPGGAVRGAFGIWEAS